MSFQKYAEYKESGIEWLGEVPKHWEIRRLGVYGNFIAGSGFPHNEQGQKSGDYPFYKVSDTNLEGNSVYLVNAENYVTKEVTKKLRAKIAPAGGIMFPKVGAALLGNKRRVLTRESITDNNTIVFVPYSGVSKYWYYWLSELDFGQIANPGPVPSINETQLREVPSICPPVEEQNQIAAFLDKETTKIDTLIDKQEQLITLLREKRQAIISHAVTRGLTPNVNMKDSGIEWLGTVPEHWEVSHLRWFISIKSGEGLSDSQFSKKILDEDSYPVIGGNGTMGYSKHFNTTQKAFAIGRVGALCGNVHFFKEKCWITDNALKVSKWEGFNDSYFEYMLRAANLNQYANQSAQPLITGEQVKALPVPRLPLEEQKQIAAFLDKETTKIDTLIEKCETAIELLKERRTALISAAVTGKIDVRGVAP